MPLRALSLLFILCISCTSVFAQLIQGEVLDMEDKLPVSGVVIDNIHTGQSITTGNKGAFEITAKSDQLLEFKKAGFTTARVRIPKGTVPPYFRIIIKKNVAKPEDYLVQTTRYDYKKDSIRFYELYKHELDVPTMSVMDKIASPFSAMSGKNREIWQFQEDFNAREKEKYVDRTFNEALVTKFTGLKGDSLHNYMRRFRPSYESLRGMNDYTFFSFIKNSVHRFRTPNTPRTSN